MQNDLDTNYPELDIQILGVNGAGRESGNASVTSGRDIPWLQDDESDVWTSWGVTYRDVVIVDADNVMVGAFNLTTYDLRNSDVYDALTQIFVDTASIPDFGGDFNEDGNVDAADYTVWRDQVGGPVPPGYGADGNEDGFINHQDYQIWNTHFGESIASGSGANPVPEPATLLLTLLALASVPVRMRHR